MKLFDNINDFLNSPVPTMNDIRKGLIKKFPKTLPLQIRTNYQYEKELKDEKQDSVWNMLEIAKDLADCAKDLFPGMHDGNYKDQTYYSARMYMFYYDSLKILMNSLLFDRPHQDEFYKEIEGIVQCAYIGPDNPTMYDIYCDCGEFAEAFIKKLDEEKMKKGDENNEEENK